MYRRLLLTIVLLNITLFICASTWGTHFSRALFALENVALNLAIAVLIRDHYIRNMLFGLFSLLPHAFPLCFRHLAANIYKLGGMHSGAAIASGMWLLVFNIEAVKALPQYTQCVLLKEILLKMILTMDGFLFVMIVTSLPKLRARFHNAWEHLHRWLTVVFLLFLWAVFIFYTRLVQQQQQSCKMGCSSRAIIESPTFTLLALISLCVILPWFSVQRVQVVSHEVLSTHAIRLHFDYTTVAPCKTPQYAHSGCGEFHQFASIPTQDQKGYSIVISNAGDWTSDIIANPPSHLYTRGEPSLGVLYTAKLFRSVLCIATGSGIAPILGLLTTPPSHLRIFWSAPDPLQTYGNKIHQMVLQGDANAMIWDTRQKGRPDLVAEAIKMYEEAKFEAVFVISNAKVTADVVQRLENHKIPVFAPNFDS